MEAKGPSTPIRASVAHTISTYLGGLGLPTPPSTSRKNHDEKLKEAHELKKQSIRHITPPQTPSISYPVALIPISTLSEPSLADSDDASKSHMLSDSRGPYIPRSASRLSSHQEEGDISPVTETLSPSRGWLISAPKRIEDTGSPGDGLFENPRQLLYRPQQRGSSEHIGDVSVNLSSLANNMDHPFSKDDDTTYSIGNMVLPVITIANAFGLPPNISMNSQSKLPGPMMQDTIAAHDQKSNNDNLTMTQRTSLKMKTVMSVFPRRPFSRAFSDSKSTRNNPYLHNNAVYHAAIPGSQTNTEDGPPSLFSEDSSVENFQSANTPTSVGGPISAFDDDSSDDDYFGELIQLSGLGTRNLRRKKTTSRRFSRDSASLTPDRPFSRLSFSSKQDRFDSPKELEHRQISTENFIPIHQIPIPEEAQLSTSAGTFNNPPFGSLRYIRENEVYHLKDGDGFDQLVLEHDEGKNLVVSGTLDCLMMELCTAFETGDDDAYIDTFVRASWLFTSPLPLIKALTNQFRLSNTRIQERILLILDKWLRTQPEDILEIEVAKEALLMFLGEASCLGHQQLAARLTRTYSQAKEKLQNYQNSLEEARKFSGPSGNSDSTSFPENLKLFFGDESVVLEVVQYLTAVDLVLFRDASNHRALSLWWISQSAQEQDAWSWESEVPYVETEGRNNIVERIHRLLRRSINFRYWVQHEILGMRNVQDRADLISSLIHLALLLREQGNFQSCLTIIDALSAGIIINLEKTWDGVPIGRVREFSELRTLLDHKNYLAAIPKTKDFAIPYFPFFIKAIATLLNQSTNASFRYSDASKIHVDSQIDNTLYRPSTSSSVDKFNKPPPALLDFKKYRAFVKEICVSRGMARYPPNFVLGIDRRCLAFRNMEIGRTAFPRDTTSGSCSNKTRSRSGSAASLVDETLDTSSLNQVSEIIEGRIDTILSPIFQTKAEPGVDRKQQLMDTVASLHRRIRGETIPSWPNMEPLEILDYSSDPSDRNAI
ncbi:hypothetical protein ABW19_dt0210247 [Dactylella cylindrospora]|nr:hypothetical protein ABW19_dt0210247 [Dactylella cylindrospora]